MKKILITGASKGIGLAIASTFHAQGFDTIICARNPDGLKAAKIKLPGLITYQCDISQKQSVKELVEIIKEKHGTLDVLVNNGGVFLPGAIHSEEDSVFEQLMNTNLYSAYYLTKGLLPGMMLRNEGTVFNICSVASLEAYPMGSSYSISKFALLGFSKGLRQEMKGHNIRVISVLPGPTYTPSWEGMEVEEQRLMPAEDIADTVWNAYQMSKRTVIEEIVLRPQLGDL